MFYSTLAHDPTPLPARPWFLHGLLPAGQLVLLDGPSGVGKSLFAAALAAHLARLLLPSAKPDAVPILWVDSLHRYYDLTTRQHLVHDMPHASCRTLPIEPSERSDLASSTPLADLLHRLTEECRSSQPGLLIINDLEQTFPFLLQLPADQQKQFWRGLQACAATHQCTVLVLRSSGLHQPRQASRLSRLGSELAYFNLALAWHPNNAHQRLLTIAKNNFGPVGNQFLLDLNCHGQISWQSLAPHDHQRPGYQPLPQTWAKQKPRPISLTTEILEQLQSILAEPVPAKVIKDFFLAAGYAPNALRTALEQADIKLIRRDKDWWYVLQQKSTDPQIAGQGDCTQSDAHVKTNNELLVLPSEANSPSPPSFFQDLDSHFTPKHIPPNNSTTPQDQPQDQTAPHLITPLSGTPFAPKSPQLSAPNLDHSIVTASP
jgi:hypothetical protein